MILADTSIWIDHFRTGSSALRRALEQGQIAVHPFIIAELALGSLKDREQTLRLLDLLPQVCVARLDEVRTLIEARRLYNLGLGLTDVCLIASVLLAPPTQLLTKDKSLRKAAQTLGIHAALP